MDDSNHEKKLVRRMQQQLRAAQRQFSDDIQQDVIATTRDRIQESRERIARVDKQLNEIRRILPDKRPAKA